MVYACADPACDVRLEGSVDTLPQGWMRRRWLNLPDVEYYCAVHAMPLHGGTFNRPTNPPVKPRGNVAAPKRQTARENVELRGAILQALDHPEPLTIAEIRQKVGGSDGGMRGILGRMVRDGLVAETTVERVAGGTVRGRNGVRAQVGYERRLVAGHDG